MTREQMKEIWDRPGCLQPLHRVLWTKERVGPGSNQLNFDIHYGAGAIVSPKAKGKRYARKQTARS